MKRNYDQNTTTVVSEDDDGFLSQTQSNIVWVGFRLPERLSNSHGCSYTSWCNNESGAAQERPDLSVYILHLAPFAGATYSMRELRRTAEAGVRVLEHLKGKHRQLDLHPPRAVENQR